MYHIFFIHSSVDGHLGCFHVLAIVNSAAMTVGISYTLPPRGLAKAKLLPRMEVFGVG